MPSLEKHVGLLVSTNDDVIHVSLDLSGRALAVPSGVLIAEIGAGRDFNARTSFEEVVQ